MKISRLCIKTYNQFKNIEFDFTYPKGHKKEGQPLDKVCFIGLNGTGKSTLLNIIFGNYKKSTGIKIYYEFNHVKSKTTYFNTQDVFSNDIVLIDRPEMSTHPILQKEMIDWHMKYFNKSNQCFFVTHSPVIVSHFEPWEIIRLDFDKDGYVVQRNLYEGEKHVDNYVIHPKYLDIEGVYSELFGIPADVPLSNEGKEHLDKLELIVRNLRSAKKEDDQEKTDKLFPVYKKLVKKCDAYNYLSSNTKSIYKYTLRYKT